MSCDEAASAVTIDRTMTTVKRYSSIFAILIFLCGCNDDSAGPSTAEAIEPGTYAGQFFFTEKNDTIVSTVQFIFTDSTYTCIPQMMFHPPAGAGKYRIHGDSVELQDLTAHTANFDWTLILGGNFGYRRIECMIIFSQKDSVRARTRRIELSKLE